MPHDVLALNQAWDASMSVTAEELNATMSLPAPEAAWLSCAGNFCWGQPGTAHENQLFLVDYGFAQQAPSADSNTEGGFVGTPDYASASAMMHQRYGPRDDLESLVYVLLGLLLGGRLALHCHGGLS